MNKTVSNIPMRNTKFRRVLALYKRLKSDRKKHREYVLLKSNQPVSIKAERVDRNNTHSLFLKLDMLLLYESPVTLHYAVKNYMVPFIFKEIVKIFPNAQYEYQHKTITVAKVRNIGVKLSPFTLKVTIICNDGSTQNIIIESYICKSSNQWLSANTKHEFAKIIHGSNWLKLGETFSQSSKSLKDTIGSVDVVYTWCNLADKEWLNAKKHFANLANLTSDESIAETRYADNDELKYSLRSVFYYLPWVRNIYILSTGNPPQWLNIDNSNITWIKHSEIIPSTFLPTFNSHVIESYIHKINLLSDHFIYMNDDIILNKLLGYNYFFTSTGLPKSNMESCATINGEIDPDDPDYLNASRNCAEILFKDFGYYPRKIHQHSPYLLNKSTLVEIEYKYAAEINSFRKNRFRALNDLNLTSFFYHHYAYFKNRITHISANSKIIFNSSPHWKKDLKWLLKNRSTFSTVCLNEGGQTDVDWHKQLPIFMNELLPNPAPWERET